MRLTEPSVELERWTKHLMELWRTVPPTLPHRTSELIDMQRRHYYSERVTIVPLMYLSTLHDTKGVLCSYLPNI